jgi:hypothetical protein
MARSMNDAVSCFTFAGCGTSESESVTAEAFVRFAVGEDDADDCASAVRFGGGRAIERTVSRSFSVWDRADSSRSITDGSRGAAERRGPSSSFCEGPTTGRIVRLLTSAALSMLLPFGTWTSGPPERTHPCRVPVVAEPSYYQSKSVGTCSGARSPRRIAEH